MKTAPLGLNALSSICRRLATELQAGLDLRSAWQREAQRHAGHRGEPFRHIGRALDSGTSLHAALEATGPLFPPLLVAMVALGEETGQLPEAFRNLAQGYESRLRLRRTFLAKLSWPAFQLAATLVILGFLIWVMGLISNPHGPPTDLLGFGLVGNRGLAIYLAILAVVGGAIFGLYRAARSGDRWRPEVERFFERLPLLGRIRRTLAVARIAWALHLTLDSSMKVGRALDLAIRAADDATFSAGLPSLLAAVTAGRSLHDAFAATDTYPDDFLEAVDVGETSGQLVETLEKLAQRYEEKAQFLLTVLVKMASGLVWAAIATVMIVLIFRIAQIYVNAITGVGLPGH